MEQPDGCAGNEPERREPDGVLLYGEGGSGQKSPNMTNLTRHFWHILKMCRRLRNFEGGLRLAFQGARTQTPYDKDEVDARFAGLDLDDIRKMMAERLKEQHEQHHGGNKWIGTGGTSAFGHSGYSPKRTAWADRAKTGARAAGGGTAELSRFPRRCGHPDPAVSGGVQKAASFILP